MTKEEAIAHMIKEVERVERERLAAHFSIDANQQKKAAVDAIIKSLKEIKVENEDQQD
jgi:endonuclease IV